MDPASLLRELRDGHAPAARMGLFALTLGAAMVVLVMMLLAPSMDGMVGLPRHEVTTPEPHVVRQPRLTPAQRAAMRRTSVRVAASAVGVRERGGENRGKRIIMFRRSVTSIGENPRIAEPWCADFVSWAWKRAGAPIGFGGRGSDYVPELVGWAKLTHRWHPTRSGYRPRPGDLVVLRSGGDRRGHIGLVAKVGNGRIYTIEGNLRDRVARRTLKPWGDAVTGFIAPV